MTKVDPPEVPAVPRPPAAAKASTPYFHDLNRLAERLLLSTKTLRREIERGNLVAHRLGGQLRVSDDDLLAYIRMRRGV